MSSTCHLYIEPHSASKPKHIPYVFEEYLYDKGMGICVFKVHIDKELKEGRLYDFTYVPLYDSGYEVEDDSNTYVYTVLKRENSNVYYITEYYGKFIHVKESQLAGNKWVFCDIKKDLGIDLQKFKVKG